MLLLCSDGLTDMVADWHIEEMLREHNGQLEQTAQQLVDQSNRNGGKRQYFSDPDSGRHNARLASWHRAGKR